MRQKSLAEVFIGNAYVKHSKPLPSDLQVGLVGQEVIFIRRYEDNCYAVVKGRRRGPVGHDKQTAIRRYIKSGLIANAKTDKR